MIAVVTQDRSREDAAELGVAHWLFLYARTFCREALLMYTPRLKGRNHAPRREINPSDPLLYYLPCDYVHPPKPGSLRKGEHLSKRRAKEAFERVRVVAQSDYDRLTDALLAIGYDLETSRLVDRKLYAAADAYFHLQREPIPWKLAMGTPDQCAARYQRQQKDTLDLFDTLKS